jgi:hypothetical protein
MTRRPPPPTPEDELPTSVFDSKRLRPAKPTQRGHDSGADEAEQRRLRAIELATPTALSAPPAPPASTATSEPLRVISMKTPAELAAEKHVIAANKHQVRLRALGEVSPNRTPPMGYLAPPRDPREVRARRIRDYVIWGCAVVVVGCVVMLGVWFLARR